MVDSTIQNLIFDLGGVLLDLHVARSRQEFARLSGHTVEEIETKIATATCFNAHEKGLITDAEFRDGIRAIIHADMTDAQIDAAWNAMLGDIPADRLNLLKRLRKNYKVFLLSNTNSLHLPQFSETVRLNTGEVSLDTFFDKAYYSHIVKMRKPDEEIFRYVLDKSGLVPKRTLFLDDFLPNLAGAEKAGIKTFHVKNPQLIFELFA